MPRRLLTNTVVHMISLRGRGGSRVDLLETTYSSDPEMKSPKTDGSRGHFARDIRNFVIAGRSLKSVQNSLFGRDMPQNLQIK